MKTYFDIKNKKYIVTPEDMMSDIDKINKIIQKNYPDLSYELRSDGLLTLVNDESQTLKDFILLNSQKTISQLKSEGLID